jgi:hypothetical protein
VLRNIWDFCIIYANVNKEREKEMSYRTYFQNAKLFQFKFFGSFREKKKWRLLTISFFGLTIQIVRNHL